MYSVFLTLMVLIVNVLIIPLTASKQVDKRSPYVLVSRPHSLDPSTPYPKANPRSPSSSHSNTPRRRNTRRAGKLCEQRSGPPNPLRNPDDIVNPVNADQPLPFFRPPLTESDDWYCPISQHAVCDSGVDSERVLRVASGKWRLKNCNRCE